MPETSVVRKIYKWKQFTGRPSGRPKSRWEDDVRNEMRRMQIVKWTEHVLDGPKWKVIVEKAKTLPEL
jgi:inhibitor of KinA sporulation pathway (predicted exonuclease)